MTTNLSPKEKGRLLYLTLRAMEQGQSKPRFFDPFSWLKVLFDGCLTMLERVIYWLVGRILDRLRRLIKGARSS